MTRYRVTVQTTTTEVVEAENPYQAAVLASARHGGDAEVTQVARSVGRPAGAKRAGRKTTKKRTAKKAPVKKKRQLSPETRAKLAQNLAKARAARAANRKAAAKKTRAAKKR
jgi:hypothetical protein